MYCYPFLFSSLFRLYQVLRIPVIQFLFVHNRGNLTSDTASGLSGSLIFSRLALIWRINFLLGSKLILKELLILKFIFKDSAILFFFSKTSMPHRCHDLNVNYNLKILFRQMQNKIFPAVTTWAGLYKSEHLSWKVLWHAALPSSSVANSRD